VGRDPARQRLGVIEVAARDRPLELGDRSEVLPHVLLDGFRIGRVERSRDRGERDGRR
jgi:hypothetical protein